ncbi:MAG: RDD family protein [Gammaproteobacteria bacterium]
MSAIVLPAPLWRRLASAAYDALVLAAIWMVVVMADLFLLQGVAGLPYHAHLLRAELMLATLLFCGLSWTRGGQTLGMRAWRLQVRRVDGRPVTWPTALARFAWAFLAWLPLGLGVLWSALDPARRAWHDRLSGTELVLLPKN